MEKPNLEICQIRLAERLERERRTFLQTLLLSQSIHLWHRWIAETITDQGVILIAESDEWEEVGNTNVQMDTAYRRLLDKLISEGWESSSTNNQGMVITLQRHSKSTTELTISADHAKNIASLRDAGVITQEEFDCISAILVLSDQQFLECCESIVKGLGFVNISAFIDPELKVAFRQKLVRESADKMFKTDESWLITFLRHAAISTSSSLTQAIRAGQSAGVTNLLVVIFGYVSVEDIDNFHLSSSKSGMRDTVISKHLSISLVHDFAPKFGKLMPKGNFSFKKLRERARHESQAATWRSQFQSLTAISTPTRITSSKSESQMDEADLFRAMVKTGSFLLLGDPGAGKTTSLQVMAEELARLGGLTPILMHLNEYSGNLISDLGRTIDEEKPLSEEKVRFLLSSGSCVVMLDGLNEVHPQSQQSKLEEEINHFTKPTSSTARSHWIVSGRRYDYSLSRRNLEYLERNEWILQPLTPDLIFRFLADSLSGGEQEAQSTYDSFDTSMMEMCSNPLLLNMLVAVYHSKGAIPSGRGQLYTQFIDLLLAWGDEGNTQLFLSKLSHVAGTSFSKELYRDTAYLVLTNLSKIMVTTSIPWSEARLSFAQSLRQSTDPTQAADIIRRDLISRGLLKVQTGRISFFHHTFQEYFQALALKGLPIEILIPDEGVDSSKRETIVFLSGIIDSSDALVKRALKNDFKLAYDIIRSSATPVDSDLQVKVGEEILKAIEGPTIYIGEKYPIALQFCNLAANLKQTVEQFARAILRPSNEIGFADRLMRFYQELGDLNKQKEVLERLGIGDPTKTPDDLIFRAAVTAANDNNHQRAVDLYSRYIDQHPDESAAYNNRGNSYKRLGNIEAALQDYRTAIEKNPNNSLAKTNMALIQISKGQTDEAIVCLREAISLSNYHLAYFELGKLTEKQEPNESVGYYEKAVEFAIDRPTKISYTGQLANSQISTSRFSDAIRSFKRLIALNPTSPQVREWKQNIAKLRLDLDDIEKRRSVRERLRNQEDILLAVLGGEVLSAAGLKVDQIASQLILAKNDNVGLPSSLLVPLLDVPQLTAEIIRDAIQAIPDIAQPVRDILLLTTAETFEPTARIQLLAYRPPEMRVALITALEAQEAFLRGDRACYELIDRALRRVSMERDPFKYTTVIQERTEFFGRDQYIRDLRLLIQDRQPFGLYGIHKIGKSSLLVRVRQALSAYAPDVTSISVEMSLDFRNSSDLHRRILERLPDETDIPEGIVSSKYLRRKLTELQKRRQKDRPGHRILLVLDEYPYLIPDRSGKGGIRDFLEVLGMFKSLYQEEEWFSFLPCGRTSSLSRTAAWGEGENPFVGILQEKFLGPLNEDETAELVETLGSKVGLIFDPEALKQIYWTTGGHPLFTRTLGSYILAKSQGGMIDASIVNAAMQAYLNNRGDREMLYDMYRNRLDDDEKSVVQLLVASPTPLARSELMPDGASEDMRQRIRKAVNNLLDTTVIQEDDQKRLSHRYELLRKVIEQETHDIWK